MFRKKYIDLDNEEYEIARSYTCMVKIPKAKTHIYMRLRPIREDGQPRYKNINRETIRKSYKSM